MCANKKNCNCGCSTKKPLTEAKIFKKKIKVPEKDLNESIKKDLVRQSKVALDALYSLYEICDKNKIAPENLLSNLDESFKGLNKVINLLGSK